MPDATCMASVEESPEECYQLGDLESGLAKKVSVAYSALLEHIPRTNSASQD